MAGVQIISAARLDYSLVHAQSQLAILGFQMMLMDAVATRRVDGVLWLVQIDDFCNDGSCDLLDRFDDFWVIMMSTTTS